MKFTAHALPGPTKACGTRSWIGVVRNDAGRIVKSHYHGKQDKAEAEAWAAQICKGLKKGRAFVS